jgi:DNA polymerase delta subunit 2
VDVDVMPGHSDFSSSFLPQQPLNSCLFPTLEGIDSINLVTNPHKFEMNGGLQFFGTSGQNIQDIMQYQKEHDALEIMTQTLEMRHACPTAPDTLRAFPYVDQDPFVFHSAPHVYFAGNQEKYGEKLV